MERHEARHWGDGTAGGAANGRAAGYGAAPSGPCSGVIARAAACLAA
jgi:hypothetical protein